MRRPVRCGAAAALALAVASCASAPLTQAQWARIDRKPVNERELQADKAICRSTALAPAGYMANWDTLGDIGESLGTSIAAARAQADSREAILIHYKGCMAQRGYVLLE